MKKNFAYSSRRDFMKKSAAGLAAVSLLPNFKIEKTPEKINSAPNENKIVYRTLGRTGIKLPIISFGCGFINEPFLIHAALDAGITHFDTAPGYGGDKSEPVLGEVLKDRQRDSFVIASKIYLPADNRTGLLPENMSVSDFRTYFLEQLETRLKLLQMDYLDILYLYAVAKPGVLGNTMLKDLLLEIKQQGKVRFVGASFHHEEPAMIRACIEQKIYDVVLTAYNFRQPHWKEVKTAIAEAAAAGLGVVAMKLMAGVYWDKERKNLINPRAAIKWVLQDENVHTTIPGMKTFDQLELNMSLMPDLTLTPEERKDLKLGERMGLNGLYCAQCGVCRSQCRNRLDIPTAMRGYMYAYGYQNPSLAKSTLQHLSAEQLVCRECNRCAVSCSMGFDVATKLKEIVRILEVPDEFLI